MQRKQDTSTTQQGQPMECRQDSLKSGDLASDSDRGYTTDACDWLEGLEGGAWADACEEIAAFLAAKGGAQ